MSNNKELLTVSRDVLKAAVLHLGDYIRDGRMNYTRSSANEVKRRLEEILGEENGN